MLIAAGLLLAACTSGSTDRSVLSAEVPLHLEEHLAVATIEGSNPASEAGAVIEWRFDEPQAGWKPIAAKGASAVQPTRTEAGLRIPLTEDQPSFYNSERFEGFLYVELPDLRFEDWGHVEIRARAASGMRNVGLLFNHTGHAPADSDVPFLSSSVEHAGLFSDETVQTYRIPLEAREPWEGPWTHLGLWFNAVAGEDRFIEILSIRLLPVDERFSGEKVGVQTVGLRGGAGSRSQAPHRRALFMHAPGTVSYTVQVPPGGRLDVGLGVVRHDAEVKFEIAIASGADELDTVLEETWNEPSEWAQHSVDLSAYQGEVVTLQLEAKAERPGTAALWAAPTVSGEAQADFPNVIFYVIDSAGSDFMSAYEYERRTTPHIERLVAEGTLFERAYSNASYTNPSTVSFLTSLQHSVLGGLHNGRSIVPEEVVTLAEHFHGAGYQTAMLTTNPNAGRMSNLDRGVDIFRDTPLEEQQRSASDLHAAFWRWREDYPAEPYFVHFQTTDVHEPHQPPPPFAGMYLDGRGRRRLEELEARIESEDVWGPEAQRVMGGEWAEYAGGMRDTYDESMAHQDDQIARLVDQLKAAGEWERTLLVIAADHGSAAGSQDWQVLMLDPVPEAYDFTQRGTPMLRSGVSRVPLIFVWPSRIPAGARVPEPVSMLDVLPTLLDLAGLPPPEVAQGRSLAPLLLGTGEWEVRPVILDEFEVDRETGELGGRIEVVDGRWGASLEIGAKSSPEDPGDRRPVPLLLCDLREDPLCLESLHEENPDLVRKYTRFLQEQFRAHTDLARLFTRTEDSPLTPEQLETLRSLGYIQ